MYKPSAYNVFVPLKNSDTLVYNCLSGAMALWNDTDKRVYDLTGGDSDMSRAIETAGDERCLSKVMDDLCKGRFIIEQGADEARYIEKGIKLARYDSSGLGLTIAPTMNCNFGCDYCYQSEDCRDGSMSSDIQEQILRFIEERAKSALWLGVAWYGGEPLLESEIIFSLSERIIKICEKKGVNYSASMVTNGYYLTTDMAKKLLDAKVSRVQVTIDGNREAHDSRRILKGGGGTFERIISNLIAVAPNENLHIGIRVNIDRRNYNSIDGLLERLHDAGLSGRKNFSVYFAPVDICSSECLRVADNIMTAEEYAEVEAALTKKAVELALAHASLPFRMFSICAAVKPNGFVMLPNGDVHKCWNTVSDRSKRLCGIEDIERVDTAPLYKDWISCGLFTLPECRDCIILPNCTGGCSNNARNSLTTPCVSLKHNLKERLILYALDKKAISAENL